VPRTRKNRDNGISRSFGLERSQKAKPNPFEQDERLPEEFVDNESHDESFQARRRDSSRSEPDFFHESEPYEYETYEYYAYEEENADRDEGDDQVDENEFRPPEARELDINTVEPEMDLSPPQATGWIKALANTGASLVKTGLQKVGLMETASEHDSDTASIAEELIENSESPSQETSLEIDYDFHSREEEIDSATPSGVRNISDLTEEASISIPDQLRKKRRKADELIVDEARELGAVNLPQLRSRKK
jgi:hypothetical protein